MTIKREVDMVTSVTKAQTLTLTTLLGFLM